MYFPSYLSTPSYILKKSAVSRGGDNVKLEAILLDKEGSLSMVMMRTIIAEIAISTILVIVPVHMSVLVVAVTVVIVAIAVVIAAILRVVAVLLLLHTTVVSRVVPRIVTRVVTRVVIGIVTRTWVLRHWVDSRHWHWHWRWNRDRLWHWNSYRLRDWDSDGLLLCGLLDNDLGGVYDLCCWRRGRNCGLLREVKHLLRVVNDVGTFSVVHFRELLDWRTGQSL